MSILYEEMRVPSSDGIHTLAGRVYRPEGRVRGLFHVVHGMTEHIARYDPLFRRMAEDGYLCFGYDHLGHGATARDAGELGYIADRDGWRRLAQDVAVFADAAERRYAALWAGEECPPYFLMGHSMGSFVVRTTA
ncbi:MAG: alpha/beta hydrolase, partial [Eubacteriales bacterium]|nr:alpha/beta hydrolase [Eubacteriales bacterium]